MKDMEAIFKNAEESILRGIKLFQEQPTHLQVAIGSAIAVVCFKLVWRPKRIKGELSKIVDHLI